MEVLRSALRHGVGPEDIQHVLRNALVVEEIEVPNPAAEGAVTMSTMHGSTADGTPITDETVEAMADEAERGYDVEEVLRRRRGGRPPMGSAASSVESVRLDPELKRDLLLRAAEEQTSVSEVIRRAIGQYLRAS